LRRAFQLWPLRLALGRVLELPVETADRLWQSLDLGIEVQTIR
jgi:PIN domain nuclease of toxin-antitoxin system